MLVLWDVDANAGVETSAVAARSSRRRWWRCPVADDHRWCAAPAAITASLAKGFTGCPCCAGRQLSVTNSFAARYPGGVHLWHPHRNGALTPEQVLAGSPHPLWWRCPAGPDHEWQVSPLVLGSHSLKRGRRGCPFCAGKRASVTNNVANHPQLSAEWHPTANGDLSPDQVVASTGAKLWWRCLENREHQWQATGANRTRGRSCPLCTKLPRSVLEVCLAYELAEFLPELNLTNDKVVINGVIRHVDLLLTAPKVVIEVDGRYRHGTEADHARDVSKTALLQGAGYRVLRVREEPLRPVAGSDVVVPTDATVKQVADAVLRRLVELAWVPLDPSAVTGYLTQAHLRHVDEAVAVLRAQRPGRSIRLPGPVTFTRQGRWEDALRVLAHFVAREGHANVPFEHIEDGVPLGTWVGAKRAQYQQGRMPADRVATLSATPGWVWDAVEDRWESGYLSLLAFYGTHGHIAVPTEHSDENGFPLGSWVRSHRRRGGRRTMTAGQRVRLEAVPGWSYTSPLDAAWDAALEAFEAFAQREGHCRPPRHHREEGVALDAWSKQQRTRYHRGALRRDRVARLEAVPGWSWSPLDDAWEAGLVALAQHVEVTGSAAVHRHATSGTYPLGAWVREQRVRYAANELPAQRRRRLEELPGWSWSVHADAWERNYAALLTFVAREGHARVPTDHVEDGLSLASWVIRHRQDHKAGALPPDRAACLERLPGWTWDVLASRWEEHFTALTAFVAREGHARVPSSHLEGDMRLGGWVITQRQQRRTGALSDMRAERLAELPGWVWAARRRIEP